MSSVIDVFVALVAVPAVKLAAVPEILVPVNALGVPKLGVTKVGELAITADPVPVSSVKAPDKFAEVNEPRLVLLPVEVIAPVKLALVLAVIPVNEEPSPLNFVAVKVPVLGTNDSFVLLTFCGKLPVSAVTKVGYTLEAVTISFVIAVLVALPAVKLAAVPEILVPVNALGVPKLGVTKVGELAITATPLPVSSLKAPDKLLLWQNWKLFH